MKMHWGRCMPVTSSASRFSASSARSGTWSLLRPGGQDPRGRDTWDSSRSHRGVDETSRPQPDRPRRWLPPQGEILDPRSRPAVHGGVRRCLASAGRRQREDPSQQPELQSARGAAREDDQVRVPESSSFSGERHLRYVVKEFVAHYLAERCHQELDGQLVTRKAESANDNGTSGQISYRSRLGGMLNYYRRGGRVTPLWISGHNGYALLRCSF